VRDAVFLGAFLLAAAVDVRGAGTEASRAGVEFFEAKIRPVFVERCVKCHGGEKQEGGLRIDQRAAILKGGKSGPVIVPGNPESSVLIRAVRRGDPDLAMPPRDKGEPLTAAEIQNFVEWIRLGAPFPETIAGGASGSPSQDLATAQKFWSFQPLQKVSPPQAEGETRNPIDPFIRAKLRAAGLRPAPPADKRTLLRRATYDLTGLPPTSAEIDAFLADHSPDAFATVVERLLTSPQYGAHWARHWFDVARYGDTRWVGAGEEKRWPFAFTYRDWVIAALNDDMPYDRFVTLQLAADQAPGARVADQAALGFLTLGRWFTGTIPDVIDDQIDVVTRGLLGLSAQCARCHDHKYDPVSMQDYYALYGLFAASRMPVDGSGILAALPEVAPPPIDAASEREFAAKRREVDEFLTRHATALRDRFKPNEALQQYLLATVGVLEKKDNEVRALAKERGLDERIFQRWVRYLKNTTRSPHPIFAPWHALVALPENKFAARAAAVIDKEKSGKLNRHAAALLTPAPATLAVLAQRYAELLAKHDVPEASTDAEQEAVRQVLRGNDSPVQVPLSELSQFLPAAEMNRLVEMRRALNGKLATLSERADLFLAAQHEAAPVLAEIRDFLAQRRTAIAADIATPGKIAAYLLAAHEVEAAGESKFKSIAKSKQLSERVLRRWMEFLEQATANKDAVFAVWRIFAAATDSAFTNQVAQLTARVREAAGNKAVAEMFVAPPASLAEVAMRYGELLARCNRTEPFAEPALEAVRRVASADAAPLRFVGSDVVDYLTQKELDGLREKERKLQRLFLESPGAAPRAMALAESARGYAQRIFVRGNPNQLGEASHGGFLSVLAPATPKAFTPGRGRLELAQAITDARNPLTARVIVNRVWHWHFGAGLVATASDFGARGTAATHPELLDWLAGEFIAHGWSLKKLHRQILLSATWQQSAQGGGQNSANPDSSAPRAALSLDPGNALLWRANRRRLGFEELRDSLLAVAGRLDEDVSGGRPLDLTRNNVRRRTVFGAVDRVTLPGFYRYFDFPGADAHVSERHETIVAQQALYLMNNGFVMEQASHVARRSAIAGDDDAAARIERLYRIALGRGPRSDERALGLEFIKSKTVSVGLTTAGGALADAWRYGTGNFSEARQRVTGFEPFPFFAGNQWKGGSQEIDPVFGRASLNQRGGFAGVSGELAVVRRWVAPRAGRVTISGALSHQLNSTQPLGDGVRARIVSSRRGQLGVWIVHGTEEPTELGGVEVESGDTIDFVCDARGREQHANFAWAPVVRFEGAATDAKEKVVWDCAKDFKGPVATPATPAFDAWDRLAQVLLESNEFSFLD
jgi:hypothetical protein